jgi:hypothetical protein
MRSDARQEAGSMTTISVSKRKYEKLSSMISPLTEAGVVPTITARCSNMGAANVWSVGHYPIPGVIELYD